MRTYYVDGDFVSPENAVIPVDDLAILRGYGVCDIMRTFRGRPFFIDEHISRLDNSAREIGLKLPWSKQDLRQKVLQTLEKNQPIDEVNIRIVITGGSSSDFFHPQGHPRLIILITDIKTLPDSWYTKGVKVITHPLERTLPNAKVISYIPAAIALEKAKKAGAIEAIYVNRENQVLEGTTSNLFAFINQTLVTPEHGVLKGITRHAVLKLAKERYSVEEKAISLETILKADEVFITGTNKGIVPVTQIDQTTISGGVPGKETKCLISDLERQTLTFMNS